MQANETTNTANKHSLLKKINAEEAFLQGQQYIEQANLPLAELTLTHIPTNSPYAKLLGGNIAIQKADYNRAFLLLLPLQSNPLLIKVATSILHESLSTLFEKQGDIANALDQLIAQEPYLESSEHLNRNYDRIWYLLSELAIQDLISMRGESPNSIIQGWIDLCLASKNQDFTTSLTNWTNSYSDHPASDFAKNLLIQSLAQNNTVLNNTKSRLPSNGNIVLILPISTETLSDKALAFQLGVQAALEKYNILNEIRVYPSQVNQESIIEQYEIAKSEGSRYFIIPSFNSWKDSSNVMPSNVSWDNEDLSIRSHLHSTHSLMQDEALTIANFAVNNAMQHVTMITTNDEADVQLVKIFQSTWANLQDTKIHVITLNQNNHADITDLINLKTKISEQSHDMLLLATSAKNARTIKPYLNISTPVFAFSSVNEMVNTEISNSSLISLRFTDIPFLIETDKLKFADLRNKSLNIQSYELLRWFALGVDYLYLLIKRSENNNKELILNGLTGTLTIDKTGNIKRQLPIVRFTYDGIVQDL